MNSRGLLSVLSALVLLGACGGTTEAAHPDVEIVAEDLRFDRSSIEMTAGVDFTIAVDNRDDLTFHNFHVTDAPGEPATKLEAGPNTQTLTFRIDEPGTYTFSCDTHPAMTGSVEVSEGSNSG